MGEPGHDSCDVAPDDRIRLASLHGGLTDSTASRGNNRISMLQLTKRRFRRIGKPRRLKDQGRNIHGIASAQIQQALSPSNPFLQESMQPLEKLYGGMILLPTTRRGRSVPPLYMPARCDLPLSRKARPPTMEPSDLCWETPAGPQGKSSIDRQQTRGEN